jgi:hypothetical protein
MALPAHTRRVHACRHRPDESTPVTVYLDRRRVMQLSLLAALPKLSLAAETGGSDAAHDFDFFLGNWRVHHRRLKKRLANNNEWEEFDGTSHCQSLLAGIVNLNESVANRPDGTSRGMGVRAFDARNRRWTDWYFSSRNPTEIALEGTGTFVNGVGTFLNDDTFDGKPIKVRGLWSQITRTSFQWEQAFSADGGATWETNWVMRHTRA